MARQLKFKPEINDDHYAVNHLTTSIWFQNMELTLMGSTGSSKRPVRKRRSVIYAKTQLESLVYRLIQERGRWPYLTLRLESVGSKMKETVPALTKQM